MLQATELSNGSITSCQQIHRHYQKRDLSWKKCLHQEKSNGRILQRSIIVSSRTGNYSKDQWLLQAIKVNIQPADFSKDDTLIFTWKEIRQSSANTAFDRQLLQGATGELFPANTLTAVGDAKHLDRLTDQKDRRKHTVPLHFPLFFSKFCYAGPDHLLPARASTGFACWKYSTETIQPSIGYLQICIVDCQSIPSFLYWFCFQTKSREDWRIISALCTGVWYQTSANTLRFP